MFEPDNPQYKDRALRLEKWRALGVDPYGQRVEGIVPTTAARALHQAENPPEGAARAKVAGRIMLLRDTGKLIFLTIQDAAGRIQVGLSKKAVEADWEKAKLLELGDRAWFEGTVGQTRTGEVTVWAAGFGIASKALLPPPDKFHGLADQELRYRQRYVDLWASPDAMRVLMMRARIVELTRAFMRGRGYVEVETPMMQPMAGGAAAKPFVTHHHALDMDLYLRIAPELYLKRLLVGGFDKVFELNRNFRNEGISPRHNPEFTMMEAYEAFGSWETMAELVESLVCHLAETLLGALAIEHKNAAGQVTKTINLQRPWRRVRMAELVEERTGWTFSKSPIGDAATGIVDKIADAYAAKAPGDAGKARAAFLEHLYALSPAEQLVEVYEKLIEPTLIDPCFVTHVPSVVIPLARENKDDPFFADVYELAVNGTELSPGYSELNDPAVQAKHFAHQVGAKDEQQQVDEDFLNALRYGMPPAGGLGLGIDRLAMLLTGAESIRDVILFPLLRPPAEKKHDGHDEEGK